MKIINCAVIGVGYLGNFHAQKYAKLPNAKLVAVCDSDAQRCSEVAELNKVQPFTDYKKLIGKVDAVSIVTPTSIHFPIAKFFLENNVHVLLEKPITTTIAEANELLSIAKQNKLTLQVGHLERFNPVFIEIKKQLAEPLCIECLRLAPYKIRCTDVSVILDLMIHDLDIIHNLVKSPIKNISAVGTAILSPTPDIVYARIEFANGVIASLTASRINMKMERKLNIFQRDIYFSGDLQEKILAITSRNGQQEITLEKGDALLDEITAFLNSIENKTSPIVSGDDGKTALATALEIEKLVLNVKR